MYTHRHTIYMYLNKISVARKHTFKTHKRLMMKFVGSCKDPTIGILKKCTAQKLLQKKKKSKDSRIQKVERIVLGKRLCSKKHFSSD